MGKLIAFRLALVVPQLILVALVVFLMTYLVPGSPAAAILGTSANPERIAQVEAQLGLDQPFFTRMITWFAAAFQGDLGTSYAIGRPVTDMILERMPATLSLVFGGLVVAVLIGLALGLLGGTRPGSTTDRTTTTITAITVAIPEFWLGIVLLLVFSVQLRWVPVIAYVPFEVDPVRWAQGLILPSIALGVGSAALIARSMRTSMAETLSARWVDTLTATGMSRGRVIFRYGLKNALIPVLASTGLTVSILIGASFVVGQVFAFPGIGDLMLRSVIGKDFPVVQGGVLMIALIVILVNFVLDICYGLLNPKARPQ
ncbi:ABC transporter permease [Microbacterium thalassium]|uniref:Peptide/nickel transport system permease protein n=1 Tax=Microbacterium thalassium TaxID=362649 RepID=A0A7X0FMT2_9MICO|nr:ABC transporter permease [Microbacterium thalassium]MBB6389935.1 peptide/nickel transport system permease protein [Microbacterium thalassium]GLK24622.1 ABC di/oligopeptide transporter inner membrane subunit [Microbacterium thalassium]